MTRSRQLVLYTVLAYALSWSIWIPGILSMNGDYQFAELGFVSYLATFGPSIAALLVVALTKGWLGVRALLARLLRWRFGWRPYLVIWFVTPLVFLLGLMLFGLRPVADALPFLLLQVVLLMPLNALLSGFLGAGPLGEELGWRGFMLPRLLEMFGDLGSSVILGLVWTFWHLPLFVFVDWRVGVATAPFILLYPVTLIALSFAMTKLYHWTKGSVFAAILMHGAVNFSTAQLIDPEAFVFGSRSSLQVYLTAVGAFLLLAAVFWLLDKRLLKRPHTPE